LNQQLLTLAADNRQLASQLALDQVVSLDNLNQQQGIFFQQDGRLKLALLLDGQRQQLCFDWQQDEVAKRTEKASKSNEIVAKAIGCKPHYRPRVLDATAGMARDSRIMAALGCKVTMRERNFAIFCLLKDALQQSDRVNQAFQYPIELQTINSLEQPIHVENFDLVYLDPMFPERKKSALVKKEMRLFKRIVGDDLDADQQLIDWLATGIKRVVVKRPKGAPCLADKKPSHEIKGKKFRYDVYLQSKSSD